MKHACPCGRSLDYEACCGILHSGRKAHNPESLMRSRYCAYVLELERYLLETWHPSTRPESVSFSSPAPKWLGLQVKTCTEDTVEFVARYKIGGRAFRLQEKSRFVFETGQWFYLDGIIDER